nr:MAG TPA: hypothetical protein [Caudoviricetes sp.]
MAEGDKYGGVTKGAERSGFRRWESCRRPNDNTARVYCIRAFIFTGRR